MPKVEKDKPLNLIDYKTIRLQAIVDKGSTQLKLWIRLPGTAELIAFRDSTGKEYFDPRQAMDLESLYQRIDQLIKSHDEKLLRYERKVSQTYQSIDRLNNENKESNHPRILELKQSIRTINEYIEKVKNHRLNALRVGLYLCSQAKFQEEKRAYFEAEETSLKTSLQGLNKQDAIDEVSSFLPFSALSDGGAELDDSYSPSSVLEKRFSRVAEETRQDTEKPKVHMIRDDQVKEKFEIILPPTNRSVIREKPLNDKEVKSDFYLESTRDKSGLKLNITFPSEPPARSETPKSRSMSIKLFENGLHIQASRSKISLDKPFDVKQASSAVEALVSLASECLVSGKVDSKQKTVRADGLVYQEISDFFKQELTTDLAKRSGGREASLLLILNPKMNTHLKLTKSDYVDIFENNIEAVFEAWSKYRVEGKNTLGQILSNPILQEALSEVANSKISSVKSIHQQKARQILREIDAYMNRRKYFGLKRMKDRVKDKRSGFKDKTKGKYRTQAAEGAGLLITKAFRTDYHVMGSQAKMFINILDDNKDSSVLSSLSNDVVIEEYICVAHGGQIMSASDFIKKLEGVPEQERTQAMGFAIHQTKKMLQEMTQNLQVEILREGGRALTTQERAKRSSTPQKRVKTHLKEQKEELKKGIKDFKRMKKAAKY
ncbi:MAG: hypothetical protein CMF48_06615 [Legionellales bacterium]|nr:hypothetical protein [Legionellales bacterium]|tara:strand:+ start:2351 stop:4336 length:1986 start_codon:yes stop_codon:yes gene_type:complete